MKKSLVQLLDEKNKKDGNNIAKFDVADDISESEMDNDDDNSTSDSSINIDEKLNENCARFLLTVISARERCICE